ncbi:MAG: cytochrome c [Flavobacteriaceae bacterium]|nr:cytochrome c [Flavobacteriaceae bacterium]
MKILINALLILLSVALVSCGNSEEKKEEKQLKIGSKEKVETKKEPQKDLAITSTIDLNNKGVGPIKDLELPATIDNEMATRGEAVFKTKCTACHKPLKKFIGPPPVGILEKRSPAWIMNMILNPEEMVQKDPIARQLLIDHNGSPMANQSLTETEAREILEYFRTLKKEEE